MPEPDDKTRLISLADAAAMYDFSHVYLKQIAKKGRLKAQKIGGVWLTTPKDMEDYIQSRQHRGAYRSDILLD